MARLNAKRSRKRQRITRAQAKRTPRLVAHHRRQDSPSRAKIVDAVHPDKVILFGDCFFKRQGVV